MLKGLKIFTQRRRINKKRGAMGAPSFQFISQETDTSLVFEVRLRLLS